MKLFAASLWLCTACAALAAAHGPADSRMRYGLDVAPNTFPQATPGEALKSVVTSFGLNRFDYAMAHLADPKFVDDRVAEYKKTLPGDEPARELLAFERLTREIREHYAKDPELLRELRTFAREGQWEEKDDVSVCSSKSIPARKVSFRKIGNRWYMLNGQ